MGMLEARMCVTRTMKASDFRAKCLKLMDEVAETGDEIVITKNGRPVARLAPYRKKRQPWSGCDPDTIQIHGDIVGPLGVEWEAESNPDRVLNP
ncbi:MAG: type II toxin-antitoxin system Phd/YefM family antitoxin [Acidobacteriota bacterium]|nr:type II toxin-antitoxin system Phd/YefM family antitoxin [Acidobacteriota bacterium]